ncbi:MAG: metalloregulator ArsR/SmtB family transcription factor [Nitrososphaerota archaeon]|nr:metalloregulator ArsR/SmtB family transcription factor [Candidatus Bathyarchaeota archaeon]MDW8023664.1 metalloregulator ArsR/SmtB family transcription factor [Nitrososphaerota archaeon]
MKNMNKFRAEVFRALADPVRLEILEFLRDGEKCVCEIIPHVGLAQPLVSRHLSILKRCGLVKYRKRGNRRLYSVTNSDIFRVIGAVDDNFVDALIKQVVEQIA